MALSFRALSRLLGMDLAKPIFSMIFLKIDRSLSIEFLLLPGALVGPDPVARGAVCAEALKKSAAERSHSPA